MKSIPYTNVILISFLSLFLMPSAHAQENLDLEIFTHPQTAVKKAVEGNKKIAFILYHEGKDSHNEILATLTRELNEHESGFVLVKCTSGRADLRDMFAKSFQQDISVLPVVLLTDSKGKQIDSACGTDIKAYSDLLINALIANKITAPLELLAVRNRINNTLELAKQATKSGDSSGFFGIPIKVENKPKALTDIRTWTRLDGSSFNGVLVIAEAAHGKFVDTKGNPLEVKFSNLSQEDINYLREKIQ